MVYQASRLLFNVPVERQRALNPDQLSKRTALKWSRSIGQDPRRSRTVRGVTALTCYSGTRFLLKQWAGIGRLIEAPKNRLLTPGRCRASRALELSRCGPR